MALEAGDQVRKMGWTGFVTSKAIVLMPLGTNHTFPEVSGFTTFWADHLDLDFSFKIEHSVS